MKASKRKRLEARGWRLISAKEFLGLTSEEGALVETKLALGDPIASSAQGDSDFVDPALGTDKVHKQPKPL